MGDRLDSRRTTAENTNQRFEVSSILAVETKPWARYGVPGCFVHLKGRGDFLAMYVIDIPKGGKTAPQKMMAEEVFYVIEGKGYDLHWDVRFDCDHEMEFTWDEEPKRFEWSQGDFVYIPPYCAHQHFNSDPNNEARIIVINSRILKPMGFDWFEQLENAEGY